MEHGPTYDPDNRLRSANKTGQTFVLTYDALGRMRRTVQDSVITADWLYDGTDMVGEYASGSLVRRYVHGPGIDEPLVWYEGSGTGSKTWLYADHQGSIAATANSAGTSTATYAYGPYGELNVTTGIRFRYTGQFWLQEIGLYYYKARFYSPTLGRFLQTDPVGYQSDLNLYAYVGNDPVNNIDPDGNVPLFIGLPIIGGVINAGFEGFGAGQAGGSAYEIAAAAGKGFISGFAATAAGLVTKNPAASGAIGGAVDEGIKTALNGKLPDSPTGFIKSVVAGAVLGKVAGAAIPPVNPTVNTSIFTTPASRDLTTDAGRQVAQTVATGLSGGIVQAVDRATSSVVNSSSGNVTGGRKP